MSRLAIEIVPREYEQMEKELTYIRDNNSLIDTVNIPDLLKFKIRSWEASAFSQKILPKSIPHLRAIDFNLKEELPFLSYLREHNINEVLVVKGDPPQDMAHKIYNTTSIQLIKLLKQEMPELKVYAAIDQYRASIKDELSFCYRKLEAGADGFFSQPFFDKRLLEIYSENLSETELFWGLSPVTTEKSQLYWESKNNVVFPAGFEPTLEWNINFAKEVMSYCKANGYHIYFMPIRVNIEKYIGGIFNS